MTIVSDVMRKKIETIDELASVQQAARKMREKNISSLVVVDRDGKPQGLITERDLVRKVCTDDMPTSKVKNKEIMSYPLITIDSKSSPSIAADMMIQHNVRHLLVVDEYKDASSPVGIITPLDFTTYQEFANDETNKDTIEKILEYYI
jgi:CBS domain-containing protein